MRPSSMDLIAYFRVSSVGQIDAFGLPVQRNAVYDWAAQNGHTIVGHCSDEGVSGTVEAAQREGLACAIEKVRSGEAEGVIAANLTRIGRTLAVQETALSLIWQAGGTVFMADQGLVAQDDPDDAIRTLVRQILGAISQYERSTITSRMRKGREVKKLTGGYIGGSVPYGYILVEGKLAPSGDEQYVIGVAKALREQGLSLRAIGEELVNLGHPTRNGTTWAPQQVKLLVQSR